MNDPRTLIDNTAMGIRQWVIVGLMVVLNALDGFDVLSSAFAAPGISKEWGIERAELGIVLSAELVAWGSGRSCWAAWPIDTGARVQCWCASCS